MEKKQEQFHPDQWLKDLPTDTSVEAFDPEALISCVKCGRKSPPTRLKCLYCGVALEVSDAQAKKLQPKLRKLEDWEKGFNVVLLPQTKQVSDSQVEEVASILILEKSDAQAMVGSGTALPGARAESLTEAKVIADRLAALGVESRIVNDEDLNPERSPRRLRRVEFEDDHLVFILFNSDEVARIPFGEVALIVEGAIIQRRIESTESIKKKDDKKLLSSVEQTSDGAVLDIYTVADPVGYRVEIKGFDFSGLGSDKALIAKDNLPKLLSRLRECSPSAVVSSDYLSLRGQLAKVWDVSQKTESEGLKRSGIGKLSRSNTESSDNQLQFTKFSRLQWHLL